MFVRLVKCGIPVYYCNEYGGTDADSLKNISMIYSNQIFIQMATNKTPFLRKYLNET